MEHDYHLSIYFKSNISPLRSRIFIKKKKCHASFQFPWCTSIQSAWKTKASLASFHRFHLVSLLSTWNPSKDGPYFIEMTSFSLSLSFFSLKANTHTYTQNTGSLRHHHRSSFRVELSRVNFLLSCTCMTDTTSMASSMRHRWNTFVERCLLLNERSHSSGSSADGNREWAYKLSLPHAYTAGKWKNFGIPWNFGIRRKKLHANSSLKNI